METVFPLLIEEEVDDVFVFCIPELEPTDVVSLVDVVSLLLVEEDVEELFEFDDPYEFESVEDSEYEFPTELEVDEDVVLLSFVDFEKL